MYLLGPNSTSWMHVGQSNRLKIRGWPNVAKHPFNMRTKEMLDDVESNV